MENEKDNSRTCDRYHVHCQRGSPHASWSRENKLKEKGTMEGEWKQAEKEETRILGTGSKVLRDSEA